MEFKELKLHDATLKQVKIEWSEKIATFNITSYIAEEGGIRDVILKFLQVSSITVPFKDSWGPSSSIMSLENKDHDYMINMQSGDIILINAESFQNNII